MSCETSISNVCLARALLVFCNSYFGDSFWPKKTKTTKTRKDREEIGNTKALNVYDTLGKFLCCHLAINFLDYFSSLPSNAYSTINRQMLPEFKAETLNYLQVQCPCQFQRAF